MDVNDLRSLFTALSFTVFVAIVFWAWSSRRREEFAEASRLALDDDDDPLAGDHLQQIKSRMH